MLTKTGMDILETVARKPKRRIRGVEQKRITKEWVHDRLKKLAFTQQNKLAVRHIFWFPKHVVKGGA